MKWLQWIEMVLQGTYACWIFILMLMPDDVDRLIHLRKFLHASKCWHNVIAGQGSFHLHVRTHLQGYCWMHIFLWHCNRKVLTENATPARPQLSAYFWWHHNRWRPLQKMLMVDGKVNHHFFTLIMESKTGKLYSHCWSQIHVPCISDSILDWVTLFLIY